MTIFNGTLPLFDYTESQGSHPGPPSRLDIHQRKLEHDKMYLNSFEIEQISRSQRSDRDHQHRAELALLRANRSSSVNRIRFGLSNMLVSIANSIRPSDVERRDIASAR